MEEAVRPPVLKKKKKINVSTASESGRNY